jgi:CRISPR system Cascade subunit CasE
MVRLSLDAARLAALSHRTGLPGRHDDIGFLVHAGLAALFGEGSVQPFRVLSERRRVAIVGYTRCDEAELRRRASEVADPTIYVACDWTELAVKEMPASWPAGRRLVFEVRACPVVRIARAIETTGRGGEIVRYEPGRELDAWLHRRLSSDDPGLVDGREGIYSEWLAARFGAAASVERVSLEGFRRVELVRRDRTLQRRARLLERPEALLRGVLEIADGEAFGRLLRRGVGRHRAYGFGMLLLRAPA